MSPQICIFSSLLLASLYHSPPASSPPGTMTRLILKDLFFKVLPKSGLSPPSLRKTASWVFTVESTEDPVKPWEAHPTQSVAHIQLENNDKCEISENTKCGGAGPSSQLAEFLQLPHFLHSKIAQSNKLSSNRKIQLPQRERERLKLN